MWERIKSAFYSVINRSYDWRDKNPDLAVMISIMSKKIEKLEKDSHPMKELHEFEVWPKLNERIEKLEEWSHPPVAPGGATEIVEAILALEKRIKKLEKNNV